MKSLITQEDLLRVKDIAEHITDSPIGFGRPISDRKSWEEAASNHELYSVIKKAEEKLKLPLPPMTDEVFLRYSRIGDRQVCDNLNAERCYRIETYVLAECLENNGRFLAGLEEVIRSICNQKTWVLTSHDPELDNFYGRDITIDLMSSALAFRLATAVYVLEDRLTDELRNLVRENIQWRVFEPFEQMLNGEREPYAWLKQKTNNWNACCLAGVVGAAMSLIDSREKRAFYAMAYEKFIVAYLNGFTEDGYCSEGLHYWGYGFGHFIAGIEIVKLATSGYLDIFQWDRVVKPALFGARTGITDKIYPSIGDCAYEHMPDARCMAYVSKRLDLNLTNWERHRAVKSHEGRLYESMLFAFGSFQKPENDKRISQEFFGKRTWFDQAGLFIGRNRGDGLSIAVKGGHNHEHHNHNDVGSFIVVSKGVQLIADLGISVYDSKTFSDQRYESQILNSSGHSVPKIAGRLQSPSGFVRDLEPSEITDRAILTEKSFRDDTDILTFDLKSLYEVASLKKMNRHYRYERDGQGKLTVTDDFAFEKNEKYESILTTYGECKVIDSNTMEIHRLNEKLTISICADGSEIEIFTESIEGRLRYEKEKPLRICIRFKEHLKEGKLILTMK